MAKRQTTKAVAARKAARAGKPVPVKATAKPTVKASNGEPSYAALDAAIRTAIRGDADMDVARGVQNAGAKDAAAWIKANILPADQDAFTAMGKTGAFVRRYVMLSLGLPDLDTAIAVCNKSNAKANDPDRRTLAQEAAFSRAKMAASRVRYGRSSDDCDWSLMLPKAKRQPATPPAKPEAEPEAEPEAKPEAKPVTPIATDQWGFMAILMSDVLPVMRAVANKNAALVPKPVADAIKALTKACEEWNATHRR